MGEPQNQVSLFEDAGVRAMHPPRAAQRSPPPPPHPVLMPLLDHQVVRDCKVLVQPFPKG